MPRFYRLAELRTNPRPELPPGVKRGQGAVWCPACRAMVYLDPNGQCIACAARRWQREHRTGEATSTPTDAVGQGKGPPARVAPGAWGREFGRY